MTFEEKVFVSFTFTVVAIGAVVGAVKFLAYWRVAFGG